MGKNAKTTQLTARQAEILALIRDGIVNGRCPTLRELMAATGIRSPNGIACHLRFLKKKGAITVDERSARGIRLTNDPVRELVDAAQVVLRKAVRPFSHAELALAEALKPFKK